ncbi:15199_t:CDS:2, partial [Cetraspora pellucida]
EQDFPEETTSTVYYLEFPNTDNPTGTIYTPAQKQKQTIFHRYTQHEFNNLSLYEQELNNGVQSTDGIKELFKFRQNKGFEAHEFLHESNQYILRNKYNTRPDPSCQVCNPVTRCNLPATFLRFWDWYRNKYRAISITSYTVENFEKA